VLGSCLSLSLSSASEFRSSSEAVDSLPPPATLSLSRARPSHVHALTNSFATTLANSTSLRDPFADLARSLGLIKGNSRMQGSPRDIVERASSAYSRRGSRSSCTRIAAGLFNSSEWKAPLSRRYACKTKERRFVSLGETRGADTRINTRAGVRERGQRGWSLLFCTRLRT